MYIAIEVRGDSLSPDTVTEAISVNPSSSFCKGDLHKSKSGKSRTDKTGGWRFYSTDLVSSENAEDHISFVFDILNSLKTPISGLHGVDTVWIDLFCDIEVSDDKHSFGNVILKKDMLNILTFHGVDVVFSYDAYEE
ncbi:MAG: DUF4279 domain-containing protein [Agarilytica sp.]